MAETPMILGLGDISPHERRAFYLSCFRRAFGYGQLQFVITTPVWVGVAIWVFHDKADGWELHAVLAGLLGLVWSLGVGFALVVAFVRSAFSTSIGSLDLVFHRAAGPTIDAKAETSAASSMQHGAV